MATTTSEIDARSRRHFADMVGLSRGTIRTMKFATVLSTIFGVAMGGLAYYEAKVSGARIERFVIYLDDQNEPVGRPIAVAAEWTPQTGVYLDFARRWVRYLRSRPADVETLKFQRGEVIRQTHRKLYTQLQPIMKQADEQLRNAAVSVDSISANLVSEDPATSTAIVLVRWVERVEESGAKSTTWTATLKIASVPPDSKLIFERNPLGLYTIEFQITRET